LGFATAKAFGSLKCRIALCARDPEELEAAKQQLTAAGYEVFTHPCDVADRESVNTLIDAVVRHYGHIDILVNNAGEITVAPFETLQMADFERAMAIMFWGIVHTTLAVLPAMKARRQGRIVNVTSVGGKVSVPHLLSYSCAKAAAVAFSSGLRNEVRKFGVSVTTIIPGLMRTGSHVNALFKGKPAAESSWFGVAASVPVLTISADRAAWMIVDAACSRRAEQVLGFPAQALIAMQTLLPSLTSEILRLSDSLLPAAEGNRSSEQGRDLEGEHGSTYRVLTTLGRNAGRRLNQPV